jgi:hypothetical protein
MKSQALSEKHFSERLEERSARPKGLRQQAKN